MNSEELYKKYDIASPLPFSNKLQVFLAEGQDELRLIIQHHLHKLGFLTFDKARDAPSALSKLRGVPTDFTLIGDNLKYIPSFDFLKELREDPLIVPGACVYITKPLTKNEAMLAIEHGMNEFVFRPIIPKELLLKIKSAYASYIHPQNPERLYVEGKSLLREENIEKALELYNDLKNLATTAARPCIGMARGYLYQEKIEKALQETNIAIERNKFYVHAFSIRAEIYLKMNMKENAFDDLRKAVELSPLNLARVEICCQLLIPEHIETCLSILQQSFQAGLQHPFVWERLGYCFFLQKNYPEALKYLEQAVKSDPENISYQNSLAICHRDAKNYEQAIQIYNTIIKKEPENISVLFNKSLCLILQEKKEEASKILKRILKIQPDFEKAKQKLKEMGESFS